MRERERERRGDMGKRDEKRERENGDKEKRKHTDRV